MYSEFWFNYVVRAVALTTSPSSLLWLVVALSYCAQRELERQPFIPPTLPMEQRQTLHLSDVGLACQANSMWISWPMLERWPNESECCTRKYQKCVNNLRFFGDVWCDVLCVSLSLSLTLCCALVFSLSLTPATPSAELYPNVLSANTSNLCILWVWGMLSIVNWSRHGKLLG